MVQLVGILNITPDSFSDAGQFCQPEAILSRAKQLFDDGAAIVDIGAESTRPGAIPLNADEEWVRLGPVLSKLLSAYPERLSLDTYHPENAQRALDLGSIIINDITGMTNPAMVDVVSRYRADCIISHLPAGDAQAAHEGDLLSDSQIVLKDLIMRASLLRAKGLNSKQIILDPGIGFGKTATLNQSLLSFASLVPDYKVMIGYSKKRFLGPDRLELAVNLLAGRQAAAAGAAYLRVHDVFGHNQLL